MKEKFYDDLKIVYDLIEQIQKETNNYYNILNKTDNDIDKENFIHAFMGSLGIEINDENKIAVIARLVSLRDDSLVQVLKKEGFNEEEVIEKKEEAYLWVADFYLKQHESLVQTIENKNLLTPFYREIFKGVHEAGKAFSSWQSSWTAHIINGVNRDLYRLFEGDEEKIFEMLNTNDLYDKGHEGEMGDRSYSVLVKDQNGFKSIPYAQAFKNEVNEAVKALQVFYSSLKKLEDEVFHQKEYYLLYISTIIEALNETNSNKLIPKWANVDRAWMKITAPLQIGHPLEYYEDHYKKAVALEWDLRITNPKQNSSLTKQNIKSMYKTLFNRVDKNVRYQNIYDNCVKNVDKVQLYLGRPALFYGAEFCGLFSAQVVPNDEQVTKEEGKKIFAFADNVLASTQAKPFLKIQKDIFGEDFLNREREIVFKKTDIWHKVYDITTIGHEFGHILWLDQDSESKMNITGNFKNIEEFKATTGGLAAFFLNEDESVKYYILSDTIKRAIGLIAWMETPEVEPYYAEGLIHLHGLFETGVLKFDNKLTIDTSDAAYEKIKTWYISTYKALAKHYLEKKDATLFLNNYAKKEKQYFTPANDRVKYFVNYYWNLYKESGRVIDDESSKENWI